MHFSGIFGRFYFPSIPCFSELSAGFSPSQMANRAFLKSSPRMVPISFPFIDTVAPSSGV